MKGSLQKNFRKCYKCCLLIFFSEVFPKVFVPTVFVCGAANVVKIRSHMNRKVVHSSLPSLRFFSVLFVKFLFLVQSKVPGNNMESLQKSCWLTAEAVPATHPAHTKKETYHLNSLFSTTISKLKT